MPGAGAYDCGRLGWEKSLFDPSRQPACRSSVIPQSLSIHTYRRLLYSGCKGSTAGDTMISLSLHKTPLKQPRLSGLPRIPLYTMVRAPNSGITSNDNVSISTNTAHTRANHFSDHIAIVNCYNQFIHIVTTMGSDAAYRYCKERYLNFNVLNEMRALREHFRAYLRQTGFVDNGSRSNKKSGNSINGVDGEDRVFDEVEQMETEMNELNLSVASNSATEGMKFRFYLHKVFILSLLISNESQVQPDLKHD